MNIKFLGMFLLLGASGGWGQEKGIKLVVWPAGEARPALRYQLLPKFLDQTPGNAADLYKIAQEKMPKDENRKLNDEIVRLLRLTVNELKSVDVEAALGPYKSAVEQARLAAWCERCVWDLPIRHPDSRNPMLQNIDYLHLYRSMLLQIRQQIAERKYDEAIESLQAGLAMARHISLYDTFEQVLVAEMIAEGVLEQVEIFVQSPDAPNLYWALSGLPSPFIDIRKSMQRQREIIFVALPQLREIESRVLSRKEAEEALGYLTSKKLLLYEDEDIDISKTIELLYPSASNYLEDEGYTTEQVKGMPLAQVILIHQLKDYYSMMDEIYKWFGVPYYQAQPGWEKLMTKWGIKEHLQYSQFSYPKFDPEEFENISIYLAKQYVGAIDISYKLATNTDLKIAVLRCVEGIRMYAAEHEGELPKSLDDITRVPIPVNPFTGEDFIYKVEQNKAILAWASDFEYPFDKLQYEITIRK